MQRSRRAGDPRHRCSGWGCTSSSPPAASCSGAAGGRCRSGSAYGVLAGSACDARWHECGHGTAFRTRWMNDVVYHIASFQVMRNPVNWRWSHARHHTDTIIVGRDAEIAWMHPIRLGLKALAMVGIVDAWQSLKVLARNAARHRCRRTRRTTSREASGPRRSSGRASTWRSMPRPRWPSRWGCCWRAWAGGRAIPLLLIGGPRVYGCWHMVMTGLLQHGGLAEDVLDHRLNCRTVYMNPVSRFLYMNMNYHVEHHMFPMVPFHALPRLHEVVKHDLPAANPSIWHAYREMMARGHAPAARARLCPAQDAARDGAALSRAPAPRRPRALGLTVAQVTQLRASGIAIRFDPRGGQLQRPRRRGRGAPDRAAAYRAVGRGRRGDAAGRGAAPRDARRRLLLRAVRRTRRRLAAAWLAGQRGLWIIVARSPSLVRAVLERPVFGATLVKEISLRDGHPFVYQRHIFIGGTGRLPVANHAMVALADRRPDPHLGQVCAGRRRPRRRRPIPAAAAPRSPIPPRPRTLPLFRGLMARRPHPLSLAAAARGIRRRHRGARSRTGLDGGDAGRGDLYLSLRDPACAADDDALALQRRPRLRALVGPAQGCLGVEEGAASTSAEPVDRGRPLPAPAP